ncbi:orcokinin isoform 2-T2 [Cochliomyia hominivorax]
MKLLYLLCVAVYLASVMGMPSKVSLTPLSSEEDYGSVRGSGTLQNLASLHDRYPIYVLGPYRSDDRQRPNLNTLRVSPELQLTNESSKIKKNFDEIDKTSASFSTLNQLI